MEEPKLMSDIEQLASSLIKIGNKEGGQMFMGKPDRWWKNPHFRCLNDHVSSLYLKTEYKGAICLECFAPVLLTFPEDNDGPLPAET